MQSDKNVVYFFLSTMHTELSFNSYSTDVLYEHNS